NDTTKDVVSSLDDIAYVKVYLDGDLPSGFIRLKNSTKDILDEFRNYSSLIEYEFINTNDFSSIDERNKLYTELSENGLEPTNLQVQENNGNSEQIIFPGAIVYYKGRSQSLNLLQNQIGTNPENVLNNSIEDIEFELTNALFKLMNNNKPSIAFLEGNNELNELETADISHSLGQVKGSLSEYFNVQRFNIKDYELEANGSPSLINQLNRLNKFEAIIIAKPTQKFTKVDKFLIDQYIMNGGKTIWFIDGVIMDMDSLKGNAPYSMAIPNDLNLTDMLFKYGLRVNYDLVMDFQADNIPIIVGYQGDVPQQQLLPWLYHPIFIPKSKHPIVKNIDGIKSSFVSSVDTVSAKNIKKTPLLFSSPYSKLPKAPHRVSLNILEQNPSIEQYNHGKIPVGYLLEGKFESVFTNRLAPNDDKLKPLNQSKANKMIVFGDGDLIKNHVNSSGLSYPLGYNHYSNTQYLGNKRMIVNALNYILGNNNIINIRAKEINLRLLNKKEIKENKLKWQLINTLLPIFIMSIIISLLLLRRKRQYR
ncbi:MAG: gliding motility-associated ABC transporter substrate-binding protein GldG, partial [Flavobacteriales bacterium]|nr:gliding motility-associated ABC transporter substrate-binding protein GldG [Flavobacteriales bacterium]